MRIYITEASCAGVTTLGQNLANQLAIQHADVDDFYWMPTNPPFTTKRAASERVSLIQQTFRDEEWVLSGSCMGRCADCRCRSDCIRCDTHARSPRAAGCPREAAFWRTDRTGWRHA